MTTATAYPAALTFLEAHEGQHLARDHDRLVRRCIEHLVDVHAVPEQAAHQLAMQALGELSARKHGAFIDCSKTTSYTLFLTDDRGTQHALTITQLVHLLDLAALQQPQ